MKGFFSRLHDSTQTGHSKSASKEPYKIWTPAVDPEQDYAQPTIIPGDGPAYPSTRQNVEKRSSSRPKPSYTVPIPSYERYATTNATAGPSSEKIPDLASRPNPNIPPSHYSRIPPQATAKATSTRYRDYSSDANKPHPPPPSATRPSFSTRTYPAHEHPAKMSRHGNSRSESTPPVAHEIWVPPNIASTSKQNDERWKDPVRPQETSEALHRYHSRVDDNDAAIDTGKRERERDRPRERERERERPRDRERGKEGREGDVDRENYRHQVKDRELDADRDRDRNREKERDREKDAAQRGRERDRQRELTKDAERDRERRARDARERELAEREREKKERERERQLDLAAKEVERDTRDRELRRPTDTTKDNDRGARAREGEPQRQGGLAQPERERREREQKPELTKDADRERRERERERRERDRAQRHLDLTKEAAERDAERAKELQRQVEARAEREAERTKELQRQTELAKAERDAERAREDQRQVELAKAAREAERAREEQRQVELAKAEREAERVRESQREAEIAKAEREAERAKEIQRQKEIAKAAREAEWREAQRQMELAKAEREAERAREAQRQMELAAAERETQRAKEAQRQADIAKAERETQRAKEAQRQADIAKAEREAERTRELQRQMELAKAAREAERAREEQRQLELAKAERNAERAREDQRQVELAKAEREAERTRETQRQAELANAEREAERARETHRQAELVKVEREAERAREAQRQKEIARAQREAEWREAQRQMELAKAEREAERAREAQRQLELVKAEREAERVREAQRLAEIAKAERETERAREIQRLTEIAKAEREAERIRETQRLAEIAKAERETERAREIQRLAEIAKAEREAERAREVQREAEIARAERDAEHAREAKRQIELAKAEREREQRQLELVEREKAKKEKELQRERDLAQAAEREKTRRDRVREEQLQRERERELAIQTTKEIAREKEHERAKAREAEREKEREAEREHADKEPDWSKDRERYLHREGERRERERQILQERDYDHKERGAEHDLNKGSPKVKEQERTEDLNAWPDQQHRDKIVPQGSRKDASIQDRDYRKAREARPSRDAPRPRDRHRDHPRYRAEATDGEQDLKRQRYVDSTDRDRRRENSSGWMSDNYTTQGRKIPRTAAVVSDTMQAEDAEASDGSISRRPRFRTNHKRTIGEGTFAKAARFHHDKPVEHVHPIPSFISGNLLSKALPGLPEINLPNTSTPHNMFVRLPPRDTRTNDPPVSEIDLLSNPPIEITDTSDIPIRAEINRWKLYPRQDESPIQPTIDPPQPVVPPTPLSHPQSSLPLEQYSRTGNPAPQRPPSRAFVPSHYPESSQNVPYVSKGTPHFAPLRHDQAPAPIPFSNNVADANTATYQFPRLRQEHSEDPPIDGAPDIPTTIEFANTVTVSNLDNVILRSSALETREQDARDSLIPQPSAASRTHLSTFQRNRQEALLPVDSQHNISNSFAKIESTETMPHSLPISTAIQQFASGGDPQILRVSISQHQPAVEASSRIDIPNVNPTERGSPARPYMPLNEDSVDFRSYSRKGVRYNSNPLQPPYFSEGIGKSHQASDARQYTSIIADRNPLDIDALRSFPKTTNKDLPPVEQKTDRRDPLHTPAPSAWPNLETSLSRPSEQQTPERFDISISRPPTRTTSKQDNPGYPPRQGASASDPKGASQPYAATFTETPTSGLTKVDLSTEVARSNSNDRQHATMVPISDSVQRLDVRVSPLQSRQPNLDSPNTRERTVKPDLGSKGEVAIPSASHRPQSKLDSPRDTQKNITTPNISRSTLPVVSDNARLLKAFNQESPRLQVDHSPRLENIQSSRILDSPLVQSAQSTSQQDTPPQFGLTYGQVAPHIPDHPSAPEVIIGSSSSTPYALSSVPQITPRRSTVTMTPKQGEDIKSYSPSSRLNPAQDPQLLSKWPGNSAANAALGRDLRIQKTQSGNDDGLSGRQPPAAQTRNPMGKNSQMSLDQNWQDRGSTQSKPKMQYKENPAEGTVDAEIPSLGFFTRTFSTALTRAADEQVLGTPQVEPTVSRNRPSLGVKTSQLETGEHSGYVPSIGRGYETQNSISQATTGPFKAQRTHSRQPSTEQPVTQNDVARADPIRPFNPYTSTYIYTNKDDEPPQILQTSNFHHPVLADLLSSPLAPKAPMVVPEALPLLPKPQEVRQRTLSSSNGNLAQPDSMRSRDFVPEVFPSTENPPEVRQRTLSSSAANRVASDLTKAREVANDAPPSPKRPQEVRQRTLSSSNVILTPSELMKAPSERLQKETTQYIPSHVYPSELAKRPVVEPSRSDAPVFQDTRAPPTRPSAVQPDLPAQPIRQSSSQRYHTEYPQRIARRPSREVLATQETRTPLVRPSTTQQVSAPIQERESPLVLPTDTARQISAQRYTSEQSQRPYGDAAHEVQPIQQASSTAMQWSSGPPQRTVTEQPREAPTSYEPRTTAIKASNSQSTPSFAQTRQAYHTTVVSDPPIPASRVPSSSNPGQTLVQPNSAPQNAPTEQATAARHRIGSSATRAAPSENFQYKVYPQTSAESRFPNVPQVSASQAAAISMQQSTSRHHHSTSLPTALPPVLPSSSGNYVSREDPPRSSTPAPIQHKLSSYQVNSAPPHTSTTSLRLRKDPSEETILLTPSSLARSMALKPTTSRQPVTPSGTSHVPRTGAGAGPGLFNMFKKTASSTQTPGQQYQIWHPTAPVKTPDSSPKSMQPPPEPNAQPASRRHLPPPISIPVTIHDRRNPSSNVFTPFRYLTTKRNRAVSVASLEAQDGTATNTVVGSPTASMHSMAPIQPPPLRDPRLATEEWRNKEEAGARALAKAKRRRQRPGVVFDVEEEHPNDIKRRPRRVKTKGRSSSKPTEPTQS